ncbi:hypothetical protein BH09VER1_BH09VER1_10270 [soil metagenome]
MSGKKIGVGLYGRNGHQIHGQLVDCSYGEVVAYAEFKKPEEIHGGATACGSLADLIGDPRVDLVSLCSPRRSDQAADAIACLRAGKHVYAEKPAAFSDEALDEILAVAAVEGREFHEMADTIYRQPFFALRELVRSGRLGEITQVWAQKAYSSSFDVRPQDENVDGGLIRQCSIHAVRMIEHITGLSITSLEAFETSLGNPHQGGLRTAAGLLLALENGAVGSVIANYYNPRGFGSHGNDQLRVFGTQGFAELTDDVRKSRVVIGHEDLGPLDASAPVEPFLQSYLKHLLGHGAMPMSLEEELHPLRVVNRAKLAVRAIASFSI